jgi:putative tryptophan/tyrosine transport system substrate-binding protein
MWWCSAVEFIVTLALSMLVTPPTVTTQPRSEVPRIGILTPAAEASTPVWEAFRQGLRDLGYVEGKNIGLEYRFAAGKPERLSELAAELVRDKVDIIVTNSGAAAQAARDATKMIPIVMATSGDPVRSGLVASLAQPGGNITGLSLMVAELGGKRLELLKEALPNVSRVAVLWDAGNPASPDELRASWVSSCTPSPSDLPTSWTTPSQP